MIRRSLIAALSVLTVLAFAALPAHAQVVRWGRPEQAVLPGLGRTHTLFAQDTFSTGDLARMRLKGRVTETHAYLEVPAANPGTIRWERVGSIATMKFDTDGNLTGILLEEPTSHADARMTVVNEFAGEGSDKHVVKRSTTTRYTNNPDAYTEVTQLTYDSQGRMTGVSTGSGDEASSQLTLERDAGGYPSVILAKDAGGGSVTERFNIEGKLVGVETTSKESPEPVRYRVDWIGPRQFKTYRLTDKGEAQVIDATLDEHGSLVSWTTTLDTTPRTFKRDVVYDAAGNWTRITMYELKNSEASAAPIAIERWNRRIDYAN